MAQNGAIATTPGCKENFTGKPDKVCIFEEEFDIEIPDDPAEKVVTVQDAYDCIHRLVKKYSSRD